MLGIHNDHPNLASLARNPSNFWHFQTQLSPAGPAHLQLHVRAGGWRHTGLLRADTDTAWRVLSDGGGWGWSPGGETGDNILHGGSGARNASTERRAMRRGSLTDRIGDVTESYKMTARVNNLIFSSLQLAGSITEPWAGKIGLECKFYHEKCKNWTKQTTFPGCIKCNKLLFCFQLKPIKLLKDFYTKVQQKLFV